MIVFDPRSRYLNENWRDFGQFNFVSPLIAKHFGNYFNSSSLEWKKYTRYKYLFLDVAWDWDEVDIMLLTLSNCLMLEAFWHTIVRDRKAVFRTAVELDWRLKDSNFWIPSKRVTKSRVRGVFKLRVVMQFNAVNNVVSEFGWSNSDTSSWNQK